MNKQFMKILLLVSLFSINGYAGGKAQVSEISEVVEISKESKYFVSLGFGVSSMNLDESINSLIRDNLHTDALDEVGSIFELEIGYYFNDALFTSLSVQRTRLELADIDNFYASVNYQLSDVALKPYIGAFVGYSVLEWDAAPYPIVINSDLSSDTLLYGIQSGAEIEVMGNWSLFGKYRFALHDHVMNIRGETATIKHKSAHNALIGVKYDF